MRLTLLIPLMVLGCLACQPAAEPADIPDELNDNSDEARRDRRRATCAAWIEPVCGSPGNCVLPPRPEYCNEFRGETASCVVWGGEEVRSMDRDAPECCRDMADPAEWGCVSWAGNWWGNWQMGLLPEPLPDDPLALSVEECAAWELPDVCETDGCAMEAENRRRGCEYHHASEDSCAAMATGATRRHWDSADDPVVETDWLCCPPGEELLHNCVPWVYGWWRSFDPRARNDR